MYDDISTFKKKAKLANFNFRTIAYNNDNDAAIPEVNDQSTPVILSQNGGAHEHPGSAQIRPAEGLSVAAVAVAENTTVPFCAEESVSSLEQQSSLDVAYTAPEDESTINDFATTTDAASQNQSDDIPHYEIPLISLFRSIATKK